MGTVEHDIYLVAVTAVKVVRGTKDVYLDILISNEEQFQMIKEELLATGTLEAHPIEAVKLFYKGSVEVDLLPFGAIENEHRETRIQKPRLFVMDVPGFQEVYRDVVTVTIEGLKVNVCSVEGLIVLKLLAYGDRPQRTKDVTDIDHLIAAYFELFSEAIYGNEVMERYDAAFGNYLDLVSARVIGRKIKALLRASPDVLQRIETILGKRPTGTWQAMLDGLMDA